MTAAQFAVRTALVLALFTAIALATPSAARAHARMVRSSPAKDAQLAQAPGQVDIWFNELLDEGFNSIDVFAATDVDASHRTGLQKGAAVLDANDRTHLSVGVQPLPPGEYVVEWRVLSRDGHSAPGRFRFRVRGPH